LRVKNSQVLRLWDNRKGPFAAALARLGDFYVNDAFSVSHRAHASVGALPRLLPHCAGRLFEKEVTVLESLLTHPRKPVMAILGGAKVSTIKAYRKLNR